MSLAKRCTLLLLLSVPAATRAKFPPPFAHMGTMVHQAFDRIATQTKSVKNPGPVLQQLSDAMQSCVACHVTYRFAPSK